VSARIPPWRWRGIWSCSCTQFQGALDTIEGSNEWCRANRRTIFGPNVPAIRKAYEDAGREVPPDFVWRTAGARDIGPTIP
jgi:limonene 1,2-monooxygenase